MDRPPTKSFSALTRRARTQFREKRPWLAKYSGRSGRARSSACCGRISSGCATGASGRKTSASYCSRSVSVLAFQSYVVRGSQPIPF
eukprot:928777-Alexandrium_andersonii.AAC.1